MEFSVARHCHKVSGALQLQSAINPGRAIRTRTNWRPSLCGSLAREIWGFDLNRFRYALTEFPECVGRSAESIFVHAWSYELKLSQLRRDSTEINDLPSQSFYYAPP